MKKITFAGKSYTLKYTIESWKKLKEAQGITPVNFQEKLEDDMGGTLSALVYYGISRLERETIDIEVLDEALGFSALDVVSEAILSDMPNVAKNVTAEGLDVLAEQDTPESDGVEETVKK